MNSIVAVNEQMMGKSVHFCKIKEMSFLHKYFLECEQEKHLPKKYFVYSGCYIGTSLFFSVNFRVTSRSNKWITAFLKFHFVATLHKYFALQIKLIVGHLRP